jgi:phosphoribosyl 1,2-cyclic phosphate phosphodiesterase
MLTVGERRLVIDAGPDFREQMLRAGVRRLRALLLTHAHKDHVGGIDDSRAFNKVEVYCDALTAKAIRKDYDYSFAPGKYPGLPDLQLRVVGESAFYIDEIKVEAIRVLHHRLPVMAYRVGKFAYVTDANCIPAASMRRLEGVEFLVIGAPRRARHLSHFSLDEALEVIDMLGVKTAFITHVSHEMGLFADVERSLPAGVCLAVDGLSFQVPG